MKRNKPIIAIDGPVGVGKSTVAARLAAQLGLLYIDTGAMYRAVTLQAMRRQLDMEDQDGIARMAQTFRIEFQRIDGVLHITCEGEDVSEAIRAPEVSKNTSAVADNPAVRHHLVALQQEMGRDGGVVMEGRDIATVVFPDAEIKIYLDADPEVRAQRRYEELLAKGKPVCYEKTYQDLLERDRRDQERATGALRVADGAIVVDTSNCSQDEVIAMLADIVQNFYGFKD